MRFAFPVLVRACLFTAILCVCAGFPCGAYSQQQGDPCRDLKTPQAIEENYRQTAKYDLYFECMAKMIEAGNYKAEPGILKSHVLPVLDHFFSNKLNKEGGYELGALLWRIMIKAGDERGARAVSEYAWSEPVKSTVSKELNLFFKPASIKIEPRKATIKKKQETVFSAAYLNRADIPLTSISPDFSSEVKPGGSGTVRLAGDKIGVRGVKGGNQSGSLVVSDKKRGLSNSVPLVFSGRMKVWWPIGGLLVTGGVGVAAATTENDGPSFALWTATGVSGIVTAVLINQYLRGGGVPYLSGVVTDHPEDELAIRLVPGPRSLELNVRF